MSNTVQRSKYAKLFGPTTGDRVRLGDTALVLRVERDHTTYGEELVFGGGKTLRDGMGQRANASQKEALDLVITNALVVDYTGIYKADIGIKDGRIAGIGKAGNPDLQEGVSPDMVIGATTEALSGEGKILTAGGLDFHVHFICPQLANAALSAGITSMLGGGTGPTEGTKATTCTPGENNIRMMLQAVDDLPINFGFLGKGNTSGREGLPEQVLAGVCGFKLHEDWGSTPAAIDMCLKVADEFDVQAVIHTDSLNESGFVERTIEAFDGRTIHTYHTEGAGGGHVPDILRVCGLPHVLPSSTNPTRPLTVNTVDEHIDMVMITHHLNPDVDTDVAFADSRIRAETIAAEDVLHDIGALSMIGSDSQAMGRIGEVITRTWQTASKMKEQRGPLAEDSDRDDNFRIRRFVAKYTINPALIHGVSDLVGSVEVGKMADLVLWDPALFGTKPEAVLKGGAIAWGKMGDPNASIPTPQPVMMRPMFGAFGRAMHPLSVNFVSQASIDSGTVEKYGLQKRLAPVRHCRSINKKDMKLNSLVPDIQVDPETFRVYADGEPMTCEPATRLPLTQRHFLF